MLFNLLQRGFQPGANPPPPNPFENPAVAGALLAVTCLWLVVAAVVFGVLVLVLVRSMHALAEVPERDRPMQPGMVWLSLIPLFGVVWVFVVALRTADALNNEFDARRLRGGGDHGKTLGIIYAVLFAVLHVSGIFSACFAPFACLGVVMAVVDVILGVLFAGQLKASTQRLRDEVDDGFKASDEKPKRRAKPTKLADDDFEEFDAPGDTPPKGDR